MEGTRSPHFAPSEERQQLDKDVGQNSALQRLGKGQLDLLHVHVQTHTHTHGTKHAAYLGGRNVVDAVNVPKLQQELDRGRKLPTTTNLAYVSFENPKRKISTAFPLLFFTPLVRPFY